MSLRNIFNSILPLSVIGVCLVLVSGFLDFGHRAADSVPCLYLHKTLASTHLSRAAEAIVTDQLTQLIFISILLVLVEFTLESLLAALDTRSTDTAKRDSQWRWRARGKISRAVAIESVCPFATCGFAAVAGGAEDTAWRWRW